MRLHQKSISKVSLLNVLKRRKTDLKQFLQETGVVTYELLKSRCDSMGVIPPEEQDFLEASGLTSLDELRNISSPAEGLIVLEPPALVKENTGQLMNNLESDNAVSLEEKSELVPDSEISHNQESSQKKKKKK